MSEQMTLDAYRATDPETSRLAAADAAVHAGTNRAAVLQVLRLHPDGLTDFELAKLVGLQQTSAGKRRGELRDLGLVVPATDEAGHTLKRPAPSGSLAIVWRAA